MESRDVCVGMLRIYIVMEGFFIETIDFKLALITVK